MSEENTLQKEDSILTSIKKLLGITKEQEYFDIDIIMLINSALVSLRQLGVGPEKGMIITGEKETWSDLLGNEASIYEHVKPYVWLCVKTAFDPPLSSVTMDAYKIRMAELEYRITVEVERRS